MSSPSVRRHSLLPNPLGRIRGGTGGYPRQFWLLFWGQLFNAMGMGIVWPFMTLYVRQEFGASLAVATGIMTLSSVAGLIATAVASPIVDRFGRKGAMVICSTVSALGLYGLSLAGTLPVWALLSVIRGAVGPLFAVGSNAMVADLVESEQRASAYALLRMSNNAGAAIGPALGGFIASVSYVLSFRISAGAVLLYTVFLALALKETVPIESVGNGSRGSGGYGRILRDRAFLTFCGLYTLIPACHTIMMVLLPVYVKENFGLLENQFGWYMTTNAAMVVFFQYGITRLTDRLPGSLVMAIGAMFYALGLGSVALGGSFWAFWASMVVMTIGEMIAFPTATTLTANLAPVDMRGRYMGVFTSTAWFGFGFGPLLGGLVSDNLGPAASWTVGLVLGLCATGGFLVLWRALRVREA